MNMSDIRRLKRLSSSFKNSADKKRLLAFLTKEEVELVCSCCKKVLVNGCYIYPGKKRVCTPCHFKKEAD